MSLARAFNRAYSRNDMTWADLIALSDSGRELDRAFRAIPRDVTPDQLEAVLESRAFNANLERNL